MRDLNEFGLQSLYDNYKNLIIHNKKKNLLLIT